MPKYRKKPVEIEARPMAGNMDDLYRLREWCGGKLACNIPVVPRGADIPSGKPEEFSLFIDTLEGEMQASWGDWIIKEVQGEFYPCRNYIFEATYDAVDN